MPLPIISNTYRVTFPHSGGSNPTANVMHFARSTGNEADVGSDIDIALSHLAANSHLFWPMSAALSVTDLDILKLDGSGVTHTYHLAHPQTGGASGHPLYAVAGVVTLQTAHRGPQGRGRQYLGPAGDDTFGSDGKLTSSGKTVCATAWEAFRNYFLDHLDAELVVASYAHSTIYGVNGTRVNDYQATMRRRAKFQQG